MAVHRAKISSDQLTSTHFNEIQDNLFVLPYHLSNERKRANVNSLDSIVAEYCMLLMIQ